MITDLSTPPTEAELIAASWTKIDSTWKHPDLPGAVATFPAVQKPGPTLEVAPKATCTADEVIATLNRPARAALAEALAKIDPPTGKHLAAIAAARDIQRNIAGTLLGNWADKIVDGEITGVMQLNGDPPFCDDSIATITLGA